MSRAMSEFLLLPHHFSLPSFRGQETNAAHSGSPLTSSRASRPAQASSLGLLPTSSKPAPRLPAEEAGGRPGALSSPQRQPPFTGGPPGPHKAEHRHLPQARLRKMGGGQDPSAIWTHSIRPVVPPRLSRTCALNTVTPVGTCVLCRLHGTAFAILAP